MKKMVYQKNRICEVLHSGEYKGYKFAIVSYGTHPAAYVEDKNGFGSFQKANEMDYLPHGKFTYFGTAHWDDNQSGNFLGWHYVHLEDYIGFYDSDTFFGRKFKKWTVAKIYDEVKSIIEELATYPVIQA